MSLIYLKPLNLLSWVAITSSVMAANLVVADSINYYALAMQAETDGDYEAAVVRYEDAALRGSADAMLALGRLARDQFQDPLAAEAWFRKAAERGDVFAQTELGALYISGDGALPMNLENARYWLEVAAKRDTEGRPAFLLHQIHPDPDEALAWLQQSAELGYVPAMAELSRLYLNGEGGAELNLRLGRKWAAQHKAALADSM